MVFWVSFTFITESLAVGGVLGVLGTLGCVPVMTMPDFSKGIWLEMLLADAARAKEIADGAWSQMVGNLGCFNFLFIPLATYFIAVPMSHTQLLGPETYTLTIVLWAIPLSTLIPSAPFDIQMALVNEIGKVWEARIRKYMQTVSDILLNTRGDTPDAETQTERLAEEHKKVERWAREVMRGTQAANTGILSFAFMWALVCVGMIGGGSGKNQMATIIVLSIFVVVMVIWVIGTIVGLAKPNLAWNTAKIELLNNPKVQRAIVLTGWSERWERWLSEHELNAARAFGVKVTMRGMRSAVSGIASIFALVMYFLLRSELQSLTA